MVLPLFAPLLAGALGGRFLAGRLEDWEEDRDITRAGARMSGILDQLPEDAGPDARATALARGGLLDPEGLLRLGSQEHMQRMSDDAAMARTQAGLGPDWARVGLARERWDWERTRAEADAAAADASRRAEIGVFNQAMGSDLSNPMIAAQLTPEQRAAGGRQIIQAQLDQLVDQAVPKPPRVDDQMVRGLDQSLNAYSTLAQNAEDISREFETYANREGGLTFDTEEAAQALQLEARITEYLQESYKTRLGAELSDFSFEQMSNIAPMPKWSGNKFMGWVFGGREISDAAAVQFWKEEAARRRTDWDRIGGQRGAAASGSSPRRPPSVVNMTRSGKPVIPEGQ